MTYIKTVKSNFITKFSVQFYYYIDFEQEEPSNRVKLTPVYCTIQCQEQDLSLNKLALNSELHSNNFISISCTL